MAIDHSHSSVLTASVGVSVCMCTAVCLQCARLLRTTIAAGINQVELAISRDASSWRRAADREIFLGIEPWGDGRYDTSQVLLAGPPVVRPDNGELWFYYNASRFNMDASAHQKYDGGKELFRLGIT